MTTATHTFDRQTMVEVLNQQQKPCLSIYQPTHRTHPGNQQDPIRFRNLFKSTVASLETLVGKHEATDLLAPLQAIAEDAEFWNTSLGGLALLRSTNYLGVFRLQQAVPELAIVAETFHLKPLLRAYQSADRFQVLCLSRQEIKLYAGTRYGLDEVPLAAGVPHTLEAALGEELTEPHLSVGSYGGVGSQQSAMHHGHGSKSSEVELDAERFFRAVDRAIFTSHSQAARVPLILASLPEHRQLFHSLSRNEYLADEGIDGNPFALTPAELCDRAWEVVRRVQRQRLEALMERFGAAKARDLGSDTLANVARAVVAGRVDTLLVDGDRQIPGRIDATTGSVEPRPLSDAKTDDALDDLGALVLKMGGELIVLQSQQMPTDTGVAAIYRY